MSEELNNLIVKVSTEFSHGTILVKDPYRKVYGSFHRKPKFRDGYWYVQLRKRWWKIESAKKIATDTYMFYVELPDGWWD